MSQTQRSSRQPLTPRPRFSTYPAQEAVLNSDARYRVLKWGRRGGKNITAVMDLIERGRHPWTSQWGADDPENTLIWWVGRSYDQAKKYGFNTLKNAVPDSWFAKPPKESEPYEIHLTNGVTYEFRTYDHPETLQGAGVDHIAVDEADYMPDSLWYDDLDPMLLDNRGSAIFISKPVRPRSYFQDLFDKGQSADWPEHFSSHATSADNPFIAENPEDKRGTVPDHKFRQQYLAELPDDGGQVFKNLGDTLFTGDFDLDGEIVDGVGELTRDPAECSAPFSIGADFARTSDYRVTMVFDVYGELAYYKRSQNESWGGIQDNLEWIASEYPGVTVPDATRDNKIIADLWHAGVNLHPTKFTPQAKVQLIDNLTVAVENGELTLPDDDRLDQVWLEFRQFEKEVTPSGYTKYHAPDNGYDDTVDAAALAYSRLGAGYVPTATAGVGGAADETADRRRFRESELGRAVDEFNDGYR